VSTGTEPAAGATGPGGAVRGADVVVRPVVEGDVERWLPLWQAYLRFYREPLPDSTTRRTFERLVHRDDGMVGLVAAREAGRAGDGGGERELLGLAHLVFHASTWSTSTYCYLEDLWVDPAARGARVGNALIEATYRVAAERGAARVYWHTQQYNGAARSLYDTVATPTSFVVYEHPLPSA
jgi:GNAT superfamily N-acetyltransferase